MKEAKKSQRSGSNRQAARIILAIIPLPFALLLTLSPEFGDLSILPTILVFGFGALIGTISHIYWLRTLLKERKFYKKFYENEAMKPLKLDKEMHKKHMKILLPFYIFGFLMFIIILFVFGIVGLDFAYLMPFALGALEGVPISYMLMERGVFS